jgi:hypothetical protein
MANVRIDANGVPKGAVWEQTVPVAHRTNVTAADGADPAPAAGVATEGYEVVDFDLDITLGGANPAVEVAPIYYDATADAWFRGASTTYSATGRYRLRAEARGALAYLKVLALTGTSPTLALNAWASMS